MQFFQTDNQVRNLVKALELNILKKTGMLTSGEYKSAFKGRGASFSELREYCYGDEIKDIDWNVTARMGSPFVKLFHEERDINIILIADISRSMRFGLPGRPKIHLLWELITLLTFMAMRNNDRVGLICFGQGPLTFLPPRKGKKYGYVLLHSMIQHSLSDNLDQTDAIKGILDILRLIKKRSVVFFISDYLFSFTRTPLTQMLAIHDAYWLHLKDPLEDPFRLGSTMHLVDLENGQSGLLPGGKWLKSEEITAKASFFAKCQSKGRYLSLYTSDPFDQKIISFFRGRSKHRRH